MNIILTGGWGYGNLGDDAILSSTIAILRDVYPKSTFIVLTYDPADSKEHKEDSVELFRSAHSYMDLGSSELMYKKIGKKYTFLNKVILKIKQKLVETELWNCRANYQRRAKQLAKTIENADLLIMCGGGYFNENWISSTYSHLHELELAKDLNIPYIIAGPTLGIYKDKNLSKKVNDALLKSTKIYVRDNSSYENLINSSVKATLIPDVALTSFSYNESSVQAQFVLGIVINNKSKDFINYIATNCLSFIEQHENCKINIILTRRWANDYEAASYLFGVLDKHISNIELSIPECHKSLEEEIIGCNLLISENLHGLILAVRNGVPIVAINDYIEHSPNQRKIKSFLEQVQCEDLVVNASSEAGYLSQVITKSNNQRAIFITNMKTLMANNYLLTTEFYLEH